MAFVLLVFQKPPVLASDIVICAPTATLAGPVIGAGEGITVTTVLAYVTGQE
jgi:hypothetical protein